ncbi:hypothetical protein IQ16_01528 [Bradyrhizobium huanghuaihaiense]|uniref:Uncharacterized protein n=1 Tax=Bradyrhizobium huanghuaihaiense TaxID=990078 RepID=A0A562RWC4_9BRAD|nr:hypothetical protein IQ16_01528 [Bradyrhizobium huanghuaihaiense]
MTVRRGAPAFGASHGRAASLDRRFQPVRSKPYRSSTIWARPRLAASVQRSGRCGRDGPDSRSGRSCPRLINPGRFDKIFRAARLEHVDQEPAGQLSCDGFAPGHLRTSTVRSHGRLNLVARNRARKKLRETRSPTSIMIFVQVSARSEPMTRVRQYRARVPTISIRSTSNGPPAHRGRSPPVEAARGALGRSVVTNEKPGCSAGLLLPEYPGKLSWRPG